MLTISDGGGGYGGTSWAGMSVMDMWLAIGNQDTTAHWQVVDGWRKSYELTLQHKAQVQSYRDNLATAWPPEKSPASAAYLARLDELIKHLQGTYDAAVANHSAFSGATLALSMARTDLEQVVNEYTANQGKLADFEASKQVRPVGMGKYVVPPPKPPVPDGRQRQLELKAQSIMYGLSTEIVQAGGQLTRPARYEPGAGMNDDKQLKDANTYSATPIPPIVPFDPGSSSTQSGSSSSAHRSPVAQPTSPDPGPSAGRSPGLVLGGVQPTPPAPPPPVVGGGGPAPIGGSPPPNVIAPAPIPSTRPGATRPVGQLSPGMSGGRGFLGENLGRPGVGGVTNGGIRAMPPGGVIGGTPAIGLGQPAAAGRPAQRVNPVGGVINSSNTAIRSGPSARGTATTGQPFGNVAGRNSGRRDDSSEATHWDPDNPWETEEGVAPVLLPTAEQHIDPGPAIGLR